ncbi:cysteine desulfurase family protein [Bogoriella caseilytica]|uniref:Cysteine desulfurase n=1 Tax=Bogoriella caseilytica TaxID=56055 RepID=A0A3N2B9F8_9MICO|nr:cysteine desulfurase family protein [Bogoriella caseilytica]ROR71734.1 cysteine desulfurase [Bogoriella caseilytica]
MSALYLDEAATAAPRREVIEAMWPYLTGSFANPASQHELGKVAARGLEEARERVAGLLGVRPSEVIFTSGGTESDNAAVKGLALGDPRGRHVLVSAIEHPAVLEPAAWLARQGFEVEHLPVDGNGVVHPEVLAERVRADTTLVSIQYANNEVGTVQDLPALSAALAVPGAPAGGVPLHTDAVQAAGAFELDVTSLGVRAMSLAGHKIGTPKGIGVLWVHRRAGFEPLIHGGGQQGGRRSGTENVAGAVGMATALDLAAGARAASEIAALRERRDHFIADVLGAVPSAELTGSTAERLPGHASFVFPGRSGESILLDLERQGIYCSSGSACAAGSTEPSHVLTAMGYAAELAQTAVRFTFGTATSAQNLERARAALAAAVR